MKVHTTETQQQFKPITLHIEIESQEEFDVIRRLFLLESSIPRFVYPENEGKGRLLSNIMRSVSTSL